MRTTIRLNEALAQRVKTVTERTGMTFTQAVERGICLFLAEQESGGQRSTFEPIPTSDNPGPVSSPEELKRLQEQLDLEYDLRKVGPGFAGGSEREAG
jgi:hypothetical protein